MSYIDDINVAVSSAMAWQRMLLSVVSAHSVLPFLVRFGSPTLVATFKGGLDIGWDVIGGNIANSAIYSIKKE